MCDRRLASGDLAESSLETFATALKRGDAEMAEGAIAGAIEQGVSPTTLHGEVVAPALRRIDELVHTGEIDAERKMLALGIARRVLATLYRFMLDGTEAGRERVLVAGMQGDEHALELQMMHDELAAAGFRTALEANLTPSGLCAALESHSPAVVLLGAPAPGSERELELAVADLRSAHGDVPIVLAGMAAGGEVPHDHHGMRVVERIDESVEAVEGVLAARATVASR